MRSRTALGGGVALLALAGTLVAVQSTGGGDENTGRHAAARAPSGLVAQAAVEHKGTAQNKDAVQNQDAAQNKNSALKPAAGADNIYYIVNKHSGKCLTVRGAATHEGAEVNQYRCVGAKNQMWIMYNQGGVGRRFENLKSHLSLSVVGRAGKGAPLVQSEYDGAPDEVFWAYLGAGHKTGRIFPYEHHNSTLCLDVQGASNADNAPVIIWTCNGRSNQTWTLKG
ncbi:RICIN domain-containing protein [Actinomycetota bacterium Odt1-20B]